MPQLRHRLKRLEQSAHALLPDQPRCPACQGRTRLAFSDEPDNTGPPHPYDGSGGTCRLCRMPPPGIHLLRLPAPIAAYFATLPWADSAPHRFIQKLMLFKALAERDTQVAERVVTRLYEHDASGMRKWRWPERTTDDAGL